MVLAQRLAFLTALATFILIGVGVLVRATGSGLGCPDWPLCHGQAIPPTDSHHTIIEFSHRLVAALVGFMVIGVAIAAWRSYRHVPLITWTATILVPLVGIQGLLGAIVVQRELPPEIVATHLVLAMIILGLMLAVALMMYEEDPSHDRAVDAARRYLRPAIGPAAAVALVWLAVVMWVGAYTAESGASTACTSWPLCNSSILPAQDEHEIVHMLHRFLAAGFAIPLLAAAWLAWRERERFTGAATWAISLVVLYVVQVFLGALNVWYEFPDTLTISHTVVATAIWFLLAGAAVLAWYRPSAVALSRPITREVPV